jgi:hypothetical protein
MISHRVLDVFSSAMGFKPPRGYIDFKKTVSGSVLLPVYAHRAHRGQLGSPVDA